MEITNDTQNNKFVANVDGGEAVILYSRKPGNIYDLYSTRVPPEARGKHVAEELVKEALRHAKSEDAQIIATCPYVSKWFEKHPEEQSILVGRSHGIENFY